MTVTNTAATKGTKSPVLDPSVDSIVLLGRQGKFLVKNIVSPSSFCQWLESSPREGERWLRSAAQDGDYATEKLGPRLLIGCGLTKPIEEEHSAVSTQHNAYPTSSPDMASSQLACKTLGSCNPSSRTRHV